MKPCTALQAIADVPNPLDASTLVEDANNAGPHGAPAAKDAADSDVDVNSDDEDSFSYGSHWESARVQQRW